MDTKSGASSADYDEFERSFDGIEFEKLGFTPKMRKEDFLQALWELRDFNARHFDFDRLRAKIAALLRQDGDSEGIMQVIHFWIYCAVMELAGPADKTVDGDVLGTAGEISGIYETIFKRNTTLSGIKLGRFANIQLAVLDQEDVPVKIFDAVSVGPEEEVVTVFEFKFTLTLRKLYQQVIGIDSAKHPHLAVLRKYPEFRHVRNLVYFGEVADERLTEALDRHFSSRPGLAARLRITNGGFSIKMSLAEVSEFLCDPKTVALAQELGRPFIAADSSSPEYKSKIARIRNTIGESIKAHHAKGNGKFDVIIAVSNAPGAEFDELRSNVTRSSANHKHEI